MARIADLTRTIQTIGFIPFVKRVWGQVFEDNVFTWASALAYSWLFAIFPFFVFLLALVPYLPADRKLELEKNMGPTLMKVLPTDAYKTVWVNYLETRLPKILNDPPKGFLSIGLLLAIWGASGGMTMTLSALDKCYDIDRGRPYYKLRSLAILMTVVDASLILVAIILLPVATIVRDWVENYCMRNGIQVRILLVVLFEVARYALALLCLVTAVATLYHFGPSVKQRFRLVTPGSTFCITVWLLLGFLFRLYINRFGKYEQTYGPVGGVVILLLFFYIDAVVLLIGAEINSEIDFVALGLKPGAKDFSGEPWRNEPALSEPASL